MKNKYFQQAKEKAYSIIRDREKLQALLANSAEKLRKLGFDKVRFEKLSERISIIIRMIKAYISGKYRMIPWRSIIVLTAALIYFVAPLDLIPDIIPVTGYLDDFTVILWVFKSLQKEIEDFLAWEQNKLVT